MGISAQLDKVTCDGEGCDAELGVPARLTGAPLARVPVMRMVTDAGWYCNIDGSTTLCVPCRQVMLRN
jgi:hypothetical protein